MGKKLWGVREVKTGYWMGGDDGPKTFDDPTMAKLAATLLNERMDPRPVAKRDAVPFIVYVSARYRVKAKMLVDEVKPRRNTLTALKQIESRARGKPRH